VGGEQFGQVEDHSSKANTENPAVEFLGKEDTNIDVELFLDDFESSGALTSLLAAGPPYCPRSPR